MLTIAVEWGGGAKDMIGGLRKNRSRTLRTAGQVLLSWLVASRLLVVVVVTDGLYRDQQVPGPFYCMGLDVSNCPLLARVARQLSRSHSV